MHWNGSEKKNKYFNKQKLSGRRKSLSTLFSDSSKLIPSKFLSLKSSGLQKIDNLRHYKFILLGEFQTSPISENLSTWVISVSHPHIADSGLCFNFDKLLFK